MTTNEYGVFSVDDILGNFYYGDGAVGGLTINGGDVGTGTASDAGSEPDLIIGLNGGDGALDVSGAGSKVEIIGNGNSTQGASIKIGQGAGSVGTANISAGGALEVIDDFGSAGSSANGGGEYIAIGASGADGELNVDFGTVLIEGTGANINIGENGGVGVVHFTSGSSLTLNSITSSSSDYVGINLGVNYNNVTGGSGTLLFDNSTGNFNGNGNTEAFFNVARETGTTGTATLQNNSQVNVNGANAQYTGISVGQNVGSSGTLNILSGSTLNVNAPVQEQYFLVGRDGGTGDVNINAATLSMNGEAEASLNVGQDINSVGTFTAEAGSTVSLSTNGRASLNIGTDFDQTGGGTGTVEFLSGSILDMNAGSDIDDRVNFNIGTDGFNTSGTLTLNSSTTTADSGGHVYMGIGRDGGTGTLNILNGSNMSWNSTGTFVAANTTFTGIDIGRDGGDGTLNITDSDFTVNNDRGEIYGNFGRGGATGDLNISNSNFLLSADSWAGFNLGRDTNSVATMDIIKGSTVQYTSDFGSYATVGRDGGTGTINIDDSSLRLVGIGSKADNHETGMQVGRGTNSNGTINITNDGLLKIKHTDGDAFLNVGRTDTSDGTVSAVDSRIDVNNFGTDSGAFLNVGRGGSTGAMSFDNSDLNVTSTNGFATLRVGANFAQTGTSDGGVSFVNDSAAIIAGNTAALSVAYTTNALGSLAVTSGSTITVADSGGSFDGSDFGSLFLIGFENGSLAGQALIDGAGSSIEGMDATIIGYHRDLEDTLTGTGNGNLRISNNGLLSTSELYVGYGGELELSSGHIISTGSLIDIEGASVLFENGLSSITGDMIVKSSQITFNYDASTNEGGSVNLIDSNTFVGSNSMVTLDVSNGFLTQGDEIALYSLTGSSTFASAFFDITNQDSGFSFVLSEDAAGGKVIALNNGDGTGSAYLDFGAASTTRAVFDFNSDFGAGNGAGGDLGYATAINVDRVLGSASDDTFFDFGSDGAYFDGRGGQDTITGGTGNDIILGGDDADTLAGASGNDTIFGGDGDDTILGNRGNDFIDAGAGADSIDGGGGIDRVWYGDSGSGVTVNLLSGKGLGGNAEGDTYSGIERVTGSEARDTIIGTAVANSLKGQGGNDVIYGVDGRDVIEGQGGRDTLYGGNSNDVVLGGADNDFVYGNRGFDQLDGGTGDDELFGGNDVDYFRFTTEGSTGFGNDIIRDFDDGADRIDVRKVASVSDATQKADEFSDFTISTSAIGIKIKFEAGQVIYIDNSTNGMDINDVTASDFVFA